MEKNGGVKVYMYTGNKKKGRKTDDFRHVSLFFAENVILFDSVKILYFTVEDESNSK